MYTPRVFEEFGRSRATPRTTKKFIHDSLNLSESLEFPRSDLEGRTTHHHELQRNHRLGNQLAVFYMISGVALAVWALHHFLIDSCRTLVTQLYLVSNRNTNLKNCPAVILFVSLATIASGIVAFSKKIFLRFVHFMLSLGIIGVLLHSAFAIKRGQPELEHFFRKDALQQLQDDYGILPEVSHSIDFIQVRFRCCGLQSPQDYDLSQWKRRALNGPNELPKTCYELKNTDIDDAALNPVVRNNTWIHRQGCLSSIHEYVVWDTWEMVGCLCGTGLLISVNMLLSCKYVR